MTYRPLNHNEHVVVSRTIYEERGLAGGLAESMFMAYKARAMALDAAEFEIFQESEIERKEKQCSKESNPSAELGPMEFLRKLDELSKNDTLRAEPKNCHEWFYGDESLLDSRRKRLRVKFFNSTRYRKQVLRRYLEDGIIQEGQLDDSNTIGILIGEFHRKYPGTRQGIISYYEILFGDPSGFCYERAMEREAFHKDASFRMTLLKKLEIPESLSISEIREDLKKSALETGVVTIEQIAQWEVNS